jgi:hypothetical protein
MRSCNGHVPLIIQEGRARAGQIPQPRRDGQNPDPDSSKPTDGGIYLYEGGGGDVLWAKVLLCKRLMVKCRARQMSLVKRLVVKCRITFFICSANQMYTSLPLRRSHDAERQADGPTIIQCEASSAAAVVFYKRTFPSNGIIMLIASKAFERAAGGRSTIPISAKEGSNPILLLLFPARYCLSSGYQQQYMGNACSAKRKPMDKNDAPRS